MKKRASVIRRKSKTPARARPKASLPPIKETDEARRSFPIVGIGASAGGLEALELFLANVTKDSGMAFVIVQHLDPTRKDMMVELIERVTTMRVMQVKNRTRVQPNCIYVIPPNKDMSILRGVLHLLEPLGQRGLRLPIDFFFRALADDQAELSIGVVLSGMGSDGTLGSLAIKEKAGAVFVQEPSSAKFDSMPRSVIAAGTADVIAKAEALPKVISAYLQRVPLVADSAPILAVGTLNALEKIIILLRTQTGHDFSLYKKSTICRRIERRMGIHQFDKINSYVRFLQDNTQEVELLFRELLIGVTNFFRDPAAWEQVKLYAMTELLSGKAGNRVLRAWVPACSTGEEAYSLAIVFREALAKIKPAHNIKLQIFATDMDPQAIDKARAGIFGANITADVSAERLSRYFAKFENGYQIAKSIREMVIFATQNIIMDPPFTKLDFISCRNLLIYFRPELQKKLFPLFHYILNPSAFLLLGSSETVGGFSHLFAPQTGKVRLYRRLNNELPAEAVEFPATFSRRLGATKNTMKPLQNIQKLAEQLLLTTYTPAAVLTNEQGAILYISGRTGKYLEPAAGKVNWNVFAMAREGLGVELNRVFQRAVRQKTSQTIDRVNVGINGGTQAVSVAVHPIREPEALRGMVMIIFHDLPPLPPGPQPRSKRRSAAPDLSRNTDLDYQLIEAQQETRSVREEMQISQEELQSTNEELQSTNEELMTSKEEMQSMNEELQTINHELLAKVDELSRLNNDMKNLFDSTDIATLFLDQTLCVRRFTSQTSKLTCLLPRDVGRPITDIASALLYPELVDDARTVLQTLASIEKQVNNADGVWYTARITPYRTLENFIDGVVITFMNISLAKKLEADLHAANCRLQELEHRT